MDRVWRFGGPWAAPRICSPGKKPTDFRSSGWARQKVATLFIPDLLFQSLPVWCVPHLCKPRKGGGCFIAKPQSLAAPARHLRAAHPKGYDLQGLLVPSQEATGALFSRASGPAMLGECVPSEGNSF